LQDTVSQHSWLKFFFLKLTFIELS
jgi:hypothetical protein